MRRWVEPYRSLAAKLIHHIAWQLSEIDRLNSRLKLLEQTGLELEAAKPHVPYKPKPMPPPIVKPADERMSLPQRLAKMNRDGERGSESWIRTLKWNRINEKEADELIEGVLRIK